MTNVDKTNWVVYRRVKNLQSARNVIKGNCSGTIQVKVFGITVSQYEKHLNAM